MKIAFFATSSLYKVGGAGYVERQLLRAFKDLELNAYIFLPDSLNSMVKAGKIKALNIGLDLLHTTSLSLWRITNIGKLLDAMKVDIAWFMGFLPNFKRSSRYRVYVYYHMLLPWYYEIRGYYRKYSWHDFSILYLGFSKGLRDVISKDANPHFFADKVLVNSKYMSLLSMRYWGIPAYILSPPIDFMKFDSYRRDYESNRGEHILLLGRISPEKRYEDALRAVALSGKRVPVILAGHLSKDVNSFRYLMFLKSLAEKLGIYLKFIFNISEEEKARLLSTARIYIHCARAEHFGVTVIEAMASGTPVIVHRSGEPYFGITDRGRFGLTYTSINDLAEKINLLISNDAIWMRYHNLSIERAQHYDYKIFLSKVRKLIYEQQNYESYTHS